MATLALSLIIGPPAGAMLCTSSEDAGCQTLFRTLPVLLGLNALLVWYGITSVPAPGTAPSTGATRHQPQPQPQKKPPQPAGLAASWGRSARVLLSSPPLRRLGLLTFFYFTPVYGAIP